MIFGYLYSDFSHTQLRSGDLWWIEEVCARKRLWKMGMFALWRLKSRSNFEFQGDPIIGLPANTYFGGPIATADLRLHPAITAIELCKGWTPRLVSDMRWPNWSNVTQAPLSQLSTIPILVGGLEHVLFFHILGITIPTDSYFSDGLKPPTSITS